jgi:F1F0 ATPase subunit 2
MTGIDAVWPIMLSTIAGAGLGVLFFGGLHWTVVRLPRARRPWLLACGSFTVRVALVVIGLFLVSAGDWKRLVAALIGWIGARVVCVRRLGPARVVSEANTRGRGGR